MLVIVKRGLAADNIQEEDGGVVSAGNIIRRGIAVSIFSDNVTRREAVGVASVDNVIMWEVVVGGFADDAPARCVVGSGAFGGVAEGYCGGGVAFGDMIADGSWWKLQR